MKRGTIVIILFLLVAIGIVTAGFFSALQDNDGDVQSALDSLQGREQPIELTIAVNPLAQPWLQHIVSIFNETPVIVDGIERQVTLVPHTFTASNATATSNATNVTNTDTAMTVLPAIDDLSVWLNTPEWTTDNHPDIWLPAASVSVEYTSLPYTVIVDSVATTPIIFGGYRSRFEAIAEDLTWDQLIAAAEAESWETIGGNPDWRFINLAFSLPDRTMSGLGVLYSAAGSLAQTTILTTDNLRGSYYDQITTITQSVPNFNSIGSDVAVFVARGPSTADIGIGPEVQWLTGIDGLKQHEAPWFSYPDYTFVFDFPVAAWSDLPDEQRAAAEAFGRWLAEQSSAADFGLRPASGSADTPLFAENQIYGIQLNPTFQTITAPDRADTQGLLAWFQRNR